MYSQRSLLDVFVCIWNRLEKPTRTYLRVNFGLVSLFSNRHPKPHMRFNTWLPTLLIILLIFVVTETFFNLKHFKGRLGSLQFRSCSHTTRSVGGVLSVGVTCHSFGRSWWLLEVLSLKIRTFVLSSNTSRP